jgi:hypothetical protein
MCFGSSGEAGGSGGSSQRITPPKPTTDADGTASAPRPPGAGSDMLTPKTDDDASRPKTILGG